MNQELDLLGLTERRWTVGEDQFLRLLTAHEMVQCAVAAKNLREKLAIDREAEALIGNAVLVALALVKEDGRPIFKDGETVYTTLPAEAINQLADRYAACREEVLGAMESVKKN